MHKGYYTTKEVSELLGIGFSTVGFMVNDGRIKDAVKIANRWMIPKTRIAKCTVCGKWFVVNAQNRTICSDECRKQKNRDSAKAAYYANKKKDPEPVECDCEQLCMEIPEPLPFEVPATTVNAQIATMFEEMANALMQIAGEYRKCAR